MNELMNKSIKEFVGNNFTIIQVVTIITCLIGIMVATVMW